MKKIPSIFRKKYKFKKLEKKLFNKLYVPEDKKYVKSLFVEVEKKAVSRLQYLQFRLIRLNSLQKKI